MKASLGLTLLAVLLASLGCESGTSPVAPDKTILLIEANPKTISVTGNSTITLTALHPTGVPARSGTEIFLTTTLGTIDDRIKTNDKGIAHATLRGDGRAGTATVKAISGTVGTKQDAAVTVSVTVGSSTPQTLKANFVPTFEGDSLTVFFEDTSEGNPTSWEWDFGDGAKSTEREPVHTYTEAASYVVTLRVRNADGQDTLSKRITVPDSEKTPPVANFTVVVVGLQATFTDASTNKVTSWEWDFGDGSRNIVQHPVHVYRQPGIYSVTLTVRNAAGASTFSKSVTVAQSQVPDANFEFSEVENLRVLFRDTSSNDPTSWEWDFGDNTAKVTDRNPTHTYSAPGTYTVSLTAGNLAGRSTETKFVAVRGPLVADFSAQKIGLKVVFTDRSRGEPTSFEWTFGDNTAKVTERNPVHTYSAAGTYIVRLIVTRTVSGGGSAQEQAVTTQSITVK